MTPNRRKALLLTAKVLLAALLLGWVLSQVHWRDHVLDKDGKTYALLAERPASPGQTGSLNVSTGLLWWRRDSTLAVDRCQPVPGTDQIRRPGFATIIRNLKVPLLVLALVIQMGNVFVMALRWWLLLRVAAIHITLWEAIRLNFLGMYFSIAVPGTVGGDLVKAYYVSKHTPAKAAALVSVFMDRVLGLTELMLMAGVMLLVAFIGRLMPPDALRLPAILVLAVVVTLVSAFAFLFSPSLRRWLRLDKIYHRLPLSSHLGVAGRAIRQYRGNIRRLVQAVGITLVGHLFWIGSLILIGKSLSLATRWYTFFLYVPLIYTIASVPLTPGGLGVVEKFFVVFFASEAVSASAVVALAMLARLVPMFWSLPGAVVAVTGAKVPPATDIQAELGLSASPAESPLPNGAQGSQRS
jgi:uncharacterized protein (TIRG00374 family)